MVLPSRSLIDLMLLSVFAYQNKSGEPVIEAAVTRIGAPFEKAPIVPRSPLDAATSTEPESTACTVSAPPRV